MAKKLIRKRFRKFKGIGWISIIIAIFAGSMVIGGFMYIPTSKRTQITKEYITIPEDGCTGDNLHLCSFRIVTVTPSPRPTRNPETTRRPRPSHSPGHRPTDGDGGGGPL